MGEIELVWDTELRLAESPVWDERARRILFGELRYGRVFAYGVDDASRHSWQLPEQELGSFGLCESGRIIAALTRTVILFDLQSGNYEVLIHDIDEPKGNRFNDGKAGPDGCFWVGTKSWKPEDGSDRESSAGLYRITPDGVMECKASGYISSNGLAWSPDGRTMFHSDSSMYTIDAWDCDPATGDIGNRRCIATSSDGLGVPDGAACDAEGNYWSAGASAGRLNQLSPSGELLSKIDMPCQAPSMPCFAGEALFVTSLVSSEMWRSTYRDPAHSAVTKRYNVAGLFRMAAPVPGAEVGCFADR